MGAAALLWPRPAPPLVVVTPPPATRAASPTAVVVVHLTGPVATPGVYRLASGSRVGDAVALAGGFTPEADDSSVNLAAPLVDGQQVAVRARGSPAPSGRSGGKLDLNQASVAELDALPGIGPVLAQRIVERRQAQGPFRSVEQLRDEKLVPGPTYERIKDLLSVG